MFHRALNKAETHLGFVYIDAMLISTTLYLNQPSNTSFVVIDYRATSFLEIAQKPVWWNMAARRAESLSQLSWHWISNRKPLSIGVVKGRLFYLAPVQCWKYVSGYGKINTTLLPIEFIRTSLTFHFNIVFLFIFIS